VFCPNFDFWKINMHLPRVYRQCRAFHFVGVWDSKQVDGTALSRNEGWWRATLMLMGRNQRALNRSFTNWQLLKLPRRHCAPGQTRQERLINCAPLLKQGCRDAGGRYESSRRLLLWGWIFQQQRELISKKQVYLHYTSYAISQSQRATCS